MSLVALFQQQPPSLAIPSSATMRLAPTLIVSSLASLLPFVSAGHFSPSRTIARLQHHEPRLLGGLLNIDLCLSIPDLLADLGLLNANIELCVCLKNLDLYIQTLDDINVPNVADVKANINTLLNETGQNCTLPAHAHRACTNTDPCHYECDTGFTDEDGQCVCAAPSVICNDQCGPATAGCGASAIARSLKSRATPITTLDQAQAICGSKTVCGVASPTSQWDFECIDTSDNFDSCGGCVTNHPFLPPQVQSRSIQARGTECGRILNARHVSCQRSRCIVQHCRTGFIVSATGDECIPASATKGHHVGRSKMHKDISRRDLIDLTIGDTPLVISPVLMKPMVGAMAAAASIPTTGTGPDVTSLMSTIQTMLASDAGSLPSNVNATMDAAKTVQTTATECGCAPALLTAVGELLSHLLALQILCQGGTPTVPGLGSCLGVDASNIVCGILPKVYVGPVILCGLLGPELTATLQNAVNGLGLRPLPPAVACPAAPVVALPPTGMAATPSSSAALATSSSPAPSTPATPTPAAASDPDIHIVVNLFGTVINITLDLNSLLNSLLGSASPSAACSPVLGGVSRLIQGIISPDGLLHPVLAGLGLSKRLDLESALSGLLGGGSPVGGALTSLTPVTAALSTLPPTINSLLTGLTGSCDAPDLSGLLNKLLAAVGNLLSGLKTCGCEANPAVINALAAMQANTTSSMAPAKRTFNSRGATSLKI